MNLTEILNKVNAGYFPSQNEDENEPDFFDENYKKHLLLFYQIIKSCMDKSPGAINRVVYGMHTIMHNNILDPNDNCLALATKKASKHVNIL